MNEITIGDKIYISSKRAAEITGYAKDYVGQLCREGHVDAKMVGRSWYVYEPSIRAHRFGTAVEEPSEEVVTEVKAEKEAEKPISTWEEAKYSAEEPQTIPEVQAPRFEELLPPAEETLTDMQEAWKEWFERKQDQLSTPEIESPEVIEARNEAHEEEEARENESIAEETATEEVSIPLHHIEEPEAPPAEPVPVYIRPVYPAEPPTVAHTTPRYIEPTRQPVERREDPVAPEATIVSERVITKKSRVRRSRTSNAPVIALLIAGSLFAVAITAIGTVYADKYIQTLGAENPVINFILGTNEFRR